jgi:sorting nexin-25
MYSFPDESLESSRAPLFDDPDDEAHLADKASLQRMAAIQAALTDIIAFDQRNDGSSHLTQRTIHSDGRQRLFSPNRSSEQGRQVGFEDSDEDDGRDEIQEQANDNQEAYQLAAPGDLQLSYEITRLGDKIANLQSQDMMLDTLIKKAELTGDTQELRLLRKSKSSMNRELRQLKFQKLQYEQQEAANRLIPGRTNVAITSSTIGEEDGKSIVRYLIEVQQLSPDGNFASGWVVARRYNEFLSMHNKLRERYALVRTLDFPGKRLVTALSASFLDNRKAALEKYLQVSGVTQWVRIRQFSSIRVNRVLLQYRPSAKVMNFEPSCLANHHSWRLSSLRCRNLRQCFRARTLFAMYIGLWQKA